MTARTSSIKIEGDYAVIRVPLEEVHSLRVALKPCPCKSAKSISTATIRDRLAKGLAMLGARK
jgi:hypothetical protein